MSAINVCVAAFEVKEANMGLHGCIISWCSGAVCTFLPISKLYQEHYGFLQSINTRC